MTVWVTGANGFIGRYLTRELADAGHRVHGVGHGALADLERPRRGLTSWINGEIDAANLNLLAAEHGPPSRVFHLAGGSSVGVSIAKPLQDFYRSVVSTAQLLEWLRGAAPECHVIAASSAAVYGPDHRGPIAEAAVLQPMSPYGQHKLMMEQLCSSYALSFGVRTTVARLFSVYGPHLHKQLPWDICCRLARGERTLVLGGTGDEIRDWADVRDVARLLAKIGDEPPQQKFHIVNCGSGRATRVAEFAGLLVKSWGSDAAVRHSGVVRAGDPFSLLADDSQLRRLPFEWRIPIEHGLAGYVRWFKDQIR